VVNLSTEVSSAPRELEEALHLLLRCSEDLLPGDRADILLLEETGGRLLLRASAGRHASRERSGVSIDIDEDLLEAIVDGNTSVLIADLQAAAAPGTPASPGSLIGVPLRSQDEVLGVLVASATEADAFAHDDLRLLEFIGQRVALEIGQAQLREREQRLAETLQRMLLPQTLPEVPGLQLAARYLPYTSGVGGDFYDAIVLHDGSLGLAIGDVTGKGLRAAAAMGRLRSALHAYALDATAPADVLTRLGRLAQADDAMATALYLILDPGQGRVAMASAGHLPPLCIDGDGARYVDIRAALTPPLGFGVERRREISLELPPGSTLLLYTDGLVERTRNIDAGMAALATAAACRRDLAPEALCERLVEEMAAGARYTDDVAVIALRRV
jgi:sigma-B regulation protein RsbU (phosphoserine phosphatase)